MTLADLIRFISNTNTKENTTMSTPHSDLRIEVQSETEKLHRRVSDLRDALDRRITALEHSVGDLTVDGDHAARHESITHTLTALDRLANDLGDRIDTVSDRVDRVVIRERETNARIDTLNKVVDDLSTQREDDYAAIGDRLGGIDKAIGDLWSQREDDWRTHLALARRVVDLERIMGYAVPESRDEDEPGTGLFDSLVDNYCRAVMSNVSPDSDEHSITPAVNLFCDVTDENPEDVASAIAETLTSAGFKPRITWGDGEYQGEAKAMPKLADEDLVEHAAGLIRDSPGEPEYVRALVELVARASGLTDDDKGWVREMIYDRAGAPYSSGFHVGMRVRHKAVPEDFGTIAATNVVVPSGEPFVIVQWDRGNVHTSVPVENLEPMFRVGMKVRHKAVPEFVGTITNLNVPVPSGEPLVSVQWSDTGATTDVPAEHIEPA